MITTDPLSTLLTLEQRLTRLLVVYELGALAPELPVARRAALVDQYLWGDGFTLGRACEIPRAALRRVPPSPPAHRLDLLRGILLDMGLEV